MPKYTMEELDKRLGDFLDFDHPVQPSGDVNTALRVADFLETNGYGFQLKDMCQKSLCDNLWSATFTHGNTEFTAEDSQSSVAICAAAVAALEGTEVS